MGSLDKAGELPNIHAILIKKSIDDSNPSSLRSFRDLYGMMDAFVVEFSLFISRLLFCNVANQYSPRKWTNQSHLTD